MAEVLASAKGAPAPNLAVTPAFWAGRAAGHPAYPPEAGKAEPAAAAAAAGGEASAVRAGRSWQLHAHSAALWLGSHKAQSVRGACA